MLQWSVRDCSSGGIMTCTAVFWIAAQVIEQRRSGLQYPPVRNRLAPLRYNPAISCVLKCTWYCTNCVCVGLSVLIYRPGQLPSRASVISGEQQAGGNSICLCLTRVHLWPPHPKAILNSMRTLMWFVSYRCLSHQFQFSLSAATLGIYLYGWQSSFLTA
jgi:hypothetical protein